MGSISLTERTRNLLRSRPRHMTYQHICEATGLDLHWVRSFGASMSQDSACGKVQILWEHLTGRTLDIDHPISPDHYS
jgi:hypothetical protein